MGHIRIISESGEPFGDRVAAGRLLADYLQHLRGRNAVVLGIPRGGVIVAAQVARALDAELDVALTRKIGAPYNPELAIGAISESGNLVIDAALAPRTGANDAYIETQKLLQLQEISRRSMIYRTVRPKVTLKDRNVVITDDGVATGATMLASLMAARNENPASLICALPVGPRDTLAKLAEQADEIVCLRVPAYFEAVGQFFDDFRQTSDEEVILILQQYKQEAA